MFNDAKRRKFTFVTPCYHLGLTSNQADLLVQVQGQIHVQVRQRTTSSLGLALFSRFFSHILYTFRVTWLIPSLLLTISAAEGRRLMILWCIASND
jgi:hypothetical protein